MVIKKQSQFSGNCGNFVQNQNKKFAPICSLAHLLPSLYCTDLLMSCWLLMINATFKKSNKKLRVQFFMNKIFIYKKNYLL